MEANSQQDKVEKKESHLKIPVEIELPKPDERVFHNTVTEKPESRKIK